jgi:hypothetical protein
LKSFLIALVSSFAIVMLLRIPCVAQQPETPPPAAAPTAAPANAPTPSDQQPPPKPSGQDSSADTAHGEHQGKSKLEQETGTVNDRILAVMPNYTVENADKLPPISTGQKYRLAAAGVFDYFTYPFNGALAAIAQANNSPKSWGQGWGAYGKRYGASFADNGIGTFMTTAVFPSMLHEDPRYYQLGHGSFPHRTEYALVRLFWTRTDSGGHRFNYSETLGNASAAALSNVYHAPEDRTWGRNLTTLGMLDMWDGVSNLMKEFWPDIHRKMQNKHKSDVTPAP